MLKNILLASLAIFLIGCNKPEKENITLNDVHSRLNPTVVSEVAYPESTEDIVQIIKRAKANGSKISISGGKHAMGGQQFFHGSSHISMDKMNDVIAFDKENGIVRVEAGIYWPKLMDYLLKEQEQEWPQWGIVQKQTGADDISIGGSLSANAHGRGVWYKPMIQDVESFTLVDAEGNVLEVSRAQNSELFSLAIGGYGLFGVIATVDLRLQPRIPVERVVEVIKLEELISKATEKIEGGVLYGDFQYKTNEQADDFMEVGVFSAYKPVLERVEIDQSQKELSPDDWRRLIALGHIDKEEAFNVYSQYYLSTNSQLYWSDSHQLGFYDPNYEESVHQLEPTYPKGSLMITEVYVPYDKIMEFIEAVKGDAKKYQYNIVYGTIRLIRKDDESYLAWAKDDYACIIFNLRVQHSPEGVEKAKNDFRKLIDRALELEGSFFLTYHHWARKYQVLKAYPQFPEFLKLKLKYDPNELFQSNWYEFMEGLTHR